MTPHTDDGWIAEEDLSTRLNIDREKMRAAREALPSGSVDTDGPWVVWKKDAARAWVAAQGLEWIEEGEDKPEMLAVASRGFGAQGYHFPNRNIIKARKLDGTMVDVRVMDSSKYLERLRNGQPMTFMARPSRHGSVYVLVGREPRYRGAW